MENNNFKLEKLCSYIVVGKLAGNRNAYIKINIREITEHTILYTQEDEDELWRQGKTEFNTTYKVIEQVHTGGVYFKGLIKRNSITHKVTPFTGYPDLINIAVPVGAKIVLEDSYMDLVWIVEK